MNASSRVLNVAVLDLQPDWGIAQILPATEGATFEPIDPGMEWNVPLQISLPLDYNEGTDVIKVFATVAPANFRWLELPALDEPMTRTLKSTETPANTLERLFATLSADEQSKRHVTVACPSPKPNPACIFNADFHGTKLCHISGWRFAGFAREIAKFADKMLIDLFAQARL